MTDFHEQAAAPLPRVRSHFDIVTPRPWPNVVAIVDRDDGAMSVMPIRLTPTYTCARTMGLSGQSRPAPVEG